MDTEKSPPRKKGAVRHRAAATKGRGTREPDGGSIAPGIYRAWLRQMWLEIAALEIRLRQVQEELQRVNGVPLQPYGPWQAGGLNLAMESSLPDVAEEGEDDWLDAYV
jgi:hypothetical protein